jgi:hypothetical protein
MAMRKLSVCVSPRVEPFLRIDAVKGFGGNNIINILMERYCALIETEMKNIKLLFSARELSSIYAICKNENWVDCDAIEGSVFALIEATPVSAAKAQERKDLLKKLKGLSLVQQYALIEIIQFHFYDPSVKNKKADKYITRKRLQEYPKENLAGRRLKGANKASPVYGPTNNGKKVPRSIFDDSLFFDPETGREQ